MSLLFAGGESLLQQAGTAKRGVSGLWKSPAVASIWPHLNPLRGVAAQNSISCEICGRRLVRCDEMRELNRTPTTREALVSLVSRCSRSGFGTLWHSPPHRGDYWRLRCLQKRIRRRGVRNDGEARRLAESRSPCRGSAVGWGEHPGSLYRATDASASGDNNRRTRTGRGAGAAR